MKPYYLIGIGLVVGTVVLFFIFQSMNISQKKQTDNNQVSDIITSNAIKDTPASPIEFPFKYLVVPGKDALDTVNKYKFNNSYPTTPIIMGGNNQITMLTDVMEYNESTPEEIIKGALEINVMDFFKEREEQDSEIFNDPEIVGVWPDNVQTSNQLTAYTDILTGKPLEEVYIGLVPTVNSYETPAYLKYGGWNACPGPEQHVALMKYWHEKYGANIISITGDTIECTVDNPPKTKEEAMVLAREQFLYCEDIVTQGCGSISALAGTLLNAKYWFFWWD
jgi:hypothetical protein